MLSEFIPTIFSRRGARGCGSFQSNQTPTQLLATRDEKTWRKLTFSPRDLLWDLP